MTLTDKEYAEIDKIIYQLASEKCDDCNSEYGYHHLCKGKNKLSNGKKCKCLICKKFIQNEK